MMTEMARQHQEATATGIRRGFEHVAEQMRTEQERQRIVPQILEGMQPFLTESQRHSQAQTEMLRGVNAHMATMQADLAGISREQVAASGQVDASLAALTSLIRNAGADIARTGANTNDLIAAFAAHLSQQNANRDQALIEALQAFATHQAHQQVQQQAGQAGRDEQLVQVLGMQQAGLAQHLGQQQAGLV